MSGTVTQTVSPPADRSMLYGSVTVSCVAMAIFLAALGIAWWTRDPSLSILLGVAASNATTVVGYWLGSSSGSKAKDAALVAQVTPPPGTITTTRTP